MGFSSAPAAYSRLMERALCNLLYNIAVAYIDDVVVYADTFEEMLSCLQTVFDHFRHAKLKLRPAKCQLFSTDIVFCGQHIWVEGRKVLVDRAACEDEIPFPHDIHSFRRVIGFFSYNRVYIKNFAHHIDPLTQMARKGAVIDDTPAAREAFETLKRAMKDAPCLSLIRDEGDFELHTDASLYALGAVLYQKQDSVLRCIEYATRSLNRAERN